MLVAIEGIDGSGKGTQARELVNRLNESGHTAELISFPRYDVTHSSKMIASYLNGEFGQLSEVPPSFAATLFALDRMESRSYIHKVCSQNELVIVDRYVASNLAYQTARAPASEQEGFSRWLYQLEYQIYNLPVPDMTIFLDVSALTSRKLVARKETRSYTKEVYDIHEGNSKYLSEVRDMYLWLIKSRIIDPCHLVECMSYEETLRKKSEIGQEIYDVVIHRINELKS